MSNRLNSVVEFCCLLLKCEMCGNKGCYTVISFGCVNHGLSSDSSTFCVCWVELLEHSTQDKVIVLLLQTWTLLYFVLIQVCNFPYFTMHYFFHHCFIHHSVSLHLLKIMEYIAINNQLECFSWFIVIEHIKSRP